MQKTLITIALVLGSLVAIKMLSARGRTATTMRARPKSAPLFNTRMFNFGLSQNEGKSGMQQVLPTAANERELKLIKGEH